MAANGYEDFEIANFISWRFMMVLTLAIPLGIYLKRSKIKPFFYISTILLPLLSICAILAVYAHLDGLIKIIMLLWGGAFACMQIAGLPYILRYANKETHSEAISLFFSTWSISVFISGMSNYYLHQLNPSFFDEGLVLIIFSIISWFSVYLISKIKIEEKVDTTEWNWSLIGDYDWILIIKATIPTLIIAIGAGFTIPVINLFFLNVHGVESDSFSVYGALTYLMVGIGVNFMPFIKRKFGYQTAITLFQSLAVVALFLMATTEYYSHLKWAAAIAVFFYIIRQPLMNVAGPMTSELTMYYVGKKNQEFISAINSAIWSGSWLFSMSLFSSLRESGWRYVTIFLITVFLYVIGVIWYAYIINEFKRRTGNDGREFSNDLND